MPANNQYLGHTSIAFAQRSTTPPLAADHVFTCSIMENFKAGCAASTSTVWCTVLGSVVLCEVNATTRVSNFINKFA